MKVMASVSFLKRNIVYQVISHHLMISQQPDVGWQAELIKDSAPEFQSILHKLPKLPSEDQIKTVIPQLKTNSWLLLVTQSIKPSYPLPQPHLSPVLLFSYPFLQFAEYIKLLLAFLFFPVSKLNYLHHPGLPSS